MWNAPKNRIPERHILRTHLETLTKAIEDATEFDMRRPDVYAALDYLRDRSTRAGGFTLFRKGLETNSLASLLQGLALIRKHLGMEE